MPDTFFELINPAAPDYPYIDAARLNLSYLSHYHNEIELICVTYGSVTVFCSHGRLTAKKGDIAVVMPGEIHSYSTEEASLSRVIKLYCKSSADTTDLAKYRFSGGIIEHGTSLCGEISSLVDKMISEHLSQKPGYAFAVNANANLILTALIRSDRFIKQDIDAHRRNEATLYLLGRVNSYIESHLAEAIPLERIATHCNMSKFYFAHTFKLSMGVTFFEYLTSYRTDIALRLLRESDYSITEISHKSGFSNTRVFNRLFRSRVGMSPSEYRKMHKNSI